MCKLVNTGIQFICILREQREFLCFLRGNTLQFILRLTDSLDEWLGSFKAACNNDLIRLGHSFIINKLPCIPAGPCLDHSDSNISAVKHAACDNKFEYCTFTLRPAREGHPLVVNQSQAHA